MPVNSALNSKRQSGFAMIEVLVTATIIAIGISGLGVLLMRAIQGTQDSAQHSQAMWIVQDYVGKIRANPDGARAENYDLDSVQPNCSSLPDPVCADHVDGGKQVAAAVCDANEMAEYDTWTAVCSLASDAYDSATDFIINPVLESDCTAYHSGDRVSTGKTIDCTQYTVSLTWDIRINNGTTDVGDTTNTNSYSLIVEVN